METVKRNDFICISGKAIANPHSKFNDLAVDKKNCLE